jgi:hypothetical protein
MNTELELELEMELDYLRNQANSLKINDMKQYEKLINIYSIKKDEPRLIILKDKVYYVNKNVLTDELGFIKGKIENDVMIWLSEDEINEDAIE